MHPKPKKPLPEPTQPLVRFNGSNPADVILINPVHVRSISTADVVAGVEFVVVDVGGMKLMRVEGKLEDVAARLGYQILSDNPP